ncbi:MAG: LysR substrate-binding domain-containing protein [Pseudomonadota bacterium]
MDRFAQLAAFVQIARSNSISAAAGRMNLAKSVVSRRLSELEARLGVQLFVRTTRQVTLTDAGARFLRRATLLLDDLEEAEDEVSASQTLLSGALKIAAPLSFGLLHLQPFLSRFAKTHPGIELEIDFADRRVDLVKEGFDLAVRIGALADSSLIARKVCPIRQLAAAAPDFWKQHGVPEHPHDLAALPCLRYSDHRRPDVIHYWGPKGEAGSVAADIMMTANNGDFLAAMAAEGHGFLVEPSFLLFQLIESGALKPVLCDYAWSNFNLYVIYPPTRQVSGRVRAFVDALTTCFAHNPHWDERIAAAS